MWSTILILSMAWSIDLQYRPIYQQIIKNKPSISKEKAVRLAKLIRMNARLYDLNPKILAAILMQESSYRLAATNCRTGLDVKDNTRKVCTDFGIGQIYYKTVKAYAMEVDRLTTDLEYSVEAAAIVLNDFKDRYGHKEKDYWTRYNTSKPSLRKIYKQRVMRWL